MLNDLKQQRIETGPCEMPDGCQWSQRVREEFGLSIKSEEEAVNKGQNACRKIDFASSEWPSREHF